MPTMKTDIKLHPSRVYAAAKLASDTLEDVRNFSALHIAEFIRGLENTVEEELPENANGEAIRVMMESVSKVRATTSGRVTPSELVVLILRDLSVRYMADW